MQRGRVNTCAPTVDVIDRQWQAVTCHTPHVCILYYYVLRFPNSPLAPHSAIGRTEYSISARTTISPTWRPLYTSENHIQAGAPTRIPQRAVSCGPGSAKIWCEGYKRAVVFLERCYHRWGGAGSCKAEKLDNPLRRYACRYPLYEHLLNVIIPFTSTTNETEPAARVSR